ncbi:metal ABC transporter ATP-binding protein [Nakamurella lactea]|uniref:metal ABC transporter ATP-binding protein n=1 Tax=Nakamurella lactea TaxID=459515 RepID=UPI0005604851
MTPVPAAGATTPAVRLRDAELAFGPRVLWSGLDLDIAPGEFVAVLGPNGAGKTSMLKMLLGQLPLTAGTVQIAGRQASRGSSAIGYVPQQRSFDPGLPVRARDLVGFGIDGHRWGLPWPGRDRRQRIDAALAAVGAGGYADSPVGMLSGGEQQRLRIAQALITDPAVLLCDEPLLSLDLAHQQAVSNLIDRRRREAHTAVVFVTHEINPILSMVDRVLYLVGGEFRIGPPDEVMTSAVLSELYGTPIDVLRAGDRIVVLGTDHHVHHGDHDDIEVL